MKAERAWLVTAALLMAVGFFRADYPGYYALEFFCPLVIYFVAFHVAAGRVPQNPRRWLAFILLLVGAAVAPVLYVFALNVVLFAYYGRLPQPPYPSWDVSLTFVWIPQLVLIYGFTLVALTIKGIRLYKTAAAGAT